MGADQSVALCCQPRSEDTNVEKVGDEANQFTKRKGMPGVQPGDALKAAAILPPSQNGEETIARRTAEPASCGLLFYSSWFCPYAQRAWAVLEELAERNVRYRFVPVNPFQIGSDERLLSIEDMQNMYGVFVDASPKARVPALNHNGKLVNDFTGGPTCAEYLSEHYSVLKPAAQADRAKVEEFWQLVDNKIADPFNAALAATDAKAQTLACESLLSGLREANDMMKSQSESGYFFGANEYSLADIALAPFFQRCEYHPAVFKSVLKHHRGCDVPQTPAYARLHNWSHPPPNLRPWRDALAQHRTCSAVAGIRNAMPTAGPEPEISAAARWRTVSSRPSYKRTVVSPQRLTSLPASGSFAWTRLGQREPDMGQ